MEKKMPKIFYDIFETLPRVGPGNYESTRKAFQLIAAQKKLPSKLNILDVGCGTGIHTIHLAELTEGKITALDNHQQFMDKLIHRLKTDNDNLSEKIECVLGDMAAMSFENESFDIIWAEGSIFIVGLENGLNDWRKFLKPGGFIALTDVFYLKEPPAKLKAHWDKFNPAMMSKEEAMTIIEKTGYNRIDHFILPPSAWWNDCYSPLEEQLKLFRIKCKDDPNALQIIDTLQMEIETYREFSDYYGYIFFIMEKK